MENEIRSQQLLKPEHRKKYQTTEFIYQALTVAEQQIIELMKEVEGLKNKQNGNI